MKKDLTLIFTILLFVFIYLLNFSISYSADKTGTISGNVIDKKTDDPLVSAKVVLYNLKDSTIHSGLFTDKKGDFAFDDIPFGKYYIVFSYIGYGNITVPNIQINSKNKTFILKNISMEQGSVMTSEVEVTAEKQTVEYSLDKKVINVEKNINSTGGSAVDVLSTIPSISVDYDGNVSMRGSTNLTILVDGKPSEALGSNRNAVLERIPASSIESVEIITNPSAKYNPEGMNGVLNIVLKKQSNIGFNGLSSLSFGTNDKYSGSVNSNYGFEDFSLFASYDIRSDRRNGSGNSFRTTTLGDSSYTQQSFNMSRKGFNNSVKLGTDIYINPKNSLTLSGNYSFDTDGHTNFNDSKVTDFLYQPTEKFTSNSFEDNKDNSLRGVMNYKMIFDKKDHALTADATYSSSHSTEIEDFTQNYYLINSIPQNGNKNIFKTVNTDRSQNANIELNYTHPYDKNSRYELGYQGIVRILDNDYVYNNFNDTTGIWSQNQALSNRFLYNEYIHAIYATYANYFSGFSYQFGLRLEQAYTKADQRTQSQIYNHNYFSVYPSVHLNYKLAETNDIQLSYSRRVNRPNVWSLNPFKDYSNPLNITFGNPYLKPEYVNSFEIGNNKNWKTTSLLSSIFYKNISDVIKRITFLDSNQIPNSTSRNLASGTSYGVEFVLEQNIFSWWKANLNFSYFRTIIKGNADSLDLTNDNYSWNAKFNTNITIWKNLNIQINSSYRAPIVTPQGIQKKTWNVDVALKKDFFNDKLSVGFRVSDIFNTQVWDFVTNGPGFSISTNRKRETRVAYLTFSYKINSGINQKDRKKNGNGGYEDDGGGAD